MVNQGVSDKIYDSKKKNFDLLTKALKFHPKQTVLPRKIWVARGQLYQASRSRSAGWSRRRSALDDKLIFKMLGFALSNYVRSQLHLTISGLWACVAMPRRGYVMVLTKQSCHYSPLVGPVRKHAQSHLEIISHVYLHTKALIHSELMTFLAKGTDPDQMKGALYCLRSKGLGTC